MPVSPFISNFSIWLWVVIECIGFGFRSVDRRFLWPCAAMLLLASRSLWLHEMPHPFSSEDIILFCVVIVISSCLNNSRLRSALLALTLSLPFAVVHIGAKPWSPNPLVGSNQAGYLLGIMFIFSFLSFVLSSKGKLINYCWLVLSMLSFVCIWQTNSRAALASVALSFLALLIKKSRNFADGVAKGVLALAAVFFVYILRIRIFGISGIPGFKQASDLGRFEIIKCYVKLPLKAMDRFLSGLGLNSNELFCQQLISGNPMDHAHSLFAQIWVFTGFFGLVGLSLLALLFAKSWLSGYRNLSEFDRIFGQTFLVYFGCQGLVDLSMVHWPLTISITAMCLSIPLQPSSRFENLSG